MTVSNIYEDPRPKSQRPADDETPVIGAHQLTIEAGITYRQLDYWTRCGYLTDAPRPQHAGSGSPRVYTLDQVDLAREMRRLIDAGLGGTRLALVADTARELLAHGSARLGDFTITPRQETNA